jgi:hypothetical protein
MSEFSDCYYLLDATSEQVIALIKKVRRYGVVLPSTNRYVPFLLDGACDAGKLANSVIENNPGTLLHYSYAEDYGLWLTVYDLINKAFSVEIQRRGSSENDLDTILIKAEQLHLVSRDRIPQLQSILEETAIEEITDLNSIRTRLSEILEITFYEWLGCADLSMQSQKKLSERFPEAVFVLKSLRGKADKAVEPTPNEWCPKPGLPAFMYLPVPSGVIDEVMLERHVEHWLETQDWDQDRNAGFWVYTAYCRALPNRMRYLANRVMNIYQAFGDELYEVKLRQTIAGILAVTDPTFDWEPYLNKVAGEQRL